MSSSSDPEKPRLIAIDLGAESCRVSLLNWRGGQPRIVMVRRFENAPEDHGSAGLRWNLDRICSELDRGIHACAELAPEGIASIGVTGWAVDYVRLEESGRPLPRLNYFLIGDVLCHRRRKADRRSRAACGRQAALCVCSGPGCSSSSPRRIL